MSKKSYGIIEQNPTPRTVWLSNKPINISALSRETGIDLSNLSKIMSGRSTKVITYRKIANALGMTLDGLLRAIEDRAEVLSTNYPPETPRTVSTV